MSRLLCPTLREDPNDAEVESHRWMVRAGLIRKVGGASGIYSLLPLGQRVVSRVEEIIRQEMDAIGGQEVRLPVVQPSELWEASGRWAVYGEDMWRLRDRHGRAYCLGPTHEEVVTDLIAHEVRSWRQLPILLYQIQNKYRDEVRPRFGVMRAREFLMKDGYSFHRDASDLEETYEAVKGAYERIFRRVGLQCRTVLADPGAIGGQKTHEFMAPADVGEAAIVYCPQCAYAADVEQAEVGVVPRQPDDATVPPPQRIATPGQTAVADVATALGVSPGSIAKFLLYQLGFADGRAALAAALIPGDAALNTAKLLAATGAVAARPATPEEAVALGLPLGYLGPVGLSADVPLYVDREVASGSEWVVGANVEGHHLRHARPGRDFALDHVLGLREAQAGDPCPECGAALLAQRGIEVGHVFALGTKYSEPLGASFLDEDGRARPILMGCYGIGVTRTVAAVIEQYHDDDGISWPVSIAPYTVILVPVGAGESGRRAQCVAERLETELGAMGISVLVDDRDERPGVKFKDADLLGFPWRVTLGKTLENGQVELRRRSTKEQSLIALDDASEAIRAAIASEMTALDGR